jgi:hypothetical protein
MSTEAAAPKVSQGPEITVRLMGRVAECQKACQPCGDVAGAAIRVRLPDDMTETTPRELISLIARQNPLLRDQIVRHDGTPRSSTRILFNGQPPADLDTRLQIREDPKTSERIIIIIFDDGTVVVVTDTTIIVFLPCDG